MLSASLNKTFLSLSVDLMSLWQLSPHQSPEEEIIEQHSRRLSPRKSPRKNYVETLDITDLGITSPFVTVQEILSIAELASC